MNGKQHHFDGVFKKLKEEAETAEDKKPTVSFNYLAELVYIYGCDNYGESHKYISMNATDAHKLKHELYRMGNFFQIYTGGEILMFMGIRVLECYNLEQGEVILSK